MVVKKPSIPLLNTVDPLFTGLLIAHPLVDGVGTSISDLSGNNHVGTAQGGFTWFNDSEIGVVAELNGSTGFIALATAINAILNAQTTASVAFWLKLRNASPTDSTKTGLCTIQELQGANTATKYPAGGSVSGETNGQGYFSVFRETSRVNGVALGATNRATWHHLVIATSSGGNYRVYINGVEVTSGVSAEFNVSSTITPWIGRSFDGTSSFWLDGWIGDFRLWTRLITASEALTMFNDPWRLYINPEVAGKIKEFGLNADLNKGREVRGITLQANLDKYPLTAVRGVTLQAELANFVALATKPEGADSALKPIIPTLHGGSDTLLTNLLLAIPFTEGTGTTAADKAGHVSGPHNSTFVAPATWTTTANFKRRDFSNAPSLNPSATGYANVTRHANFEPTSTEFTIAAWVRPTGTQATRGIFSKLGTTDQQYYLGTNAAGSAWQFAVTDSIDGRGNCDGGSVGSSLVHLVGSYRDIGSGNFQQRLYVNGVLSNTRGNSGSLPADITKDIRVGRHEGGASSFSGEIEDVRYWTRALTDQEVSDLYAAPFSIYCDFSIVRAVTLNADVNVPALTAAKAITLQADMAPVDSAAAGVRGVTLQADLVAPIANAAGMVMFSITPIFGTTAGGTVVTIKGANFKDITTVLVGGVPLTSLSVPDGQTIIGTTGAHVSGLVDVQIQSSTQGTLTVGLAYSYTPGYGAGSGALIRGKQLHASVFRQEYFNGETAPLGSNTTLALTLADTPLSPEAVELYIQKPGDNGGSLQRQGTGFSYTVDLATKKIIWRSTAPQAIAPADVLAVWYFAQVVS